MLRRFWCLALLACLPVCADAAPAQAAFPKAAGYVNDFAGILPGPTRADLELLLRDVERQTTAEIALVTVSSLEGMTVEEYANRMFQQWGIGKKAGDNGVLILVAPTERSMRIEVGYGLEGVLPDGLAGQIIRSDFLPEFGRDDYARGILQGVRRVVAVVQANETLSADQRRQLDESDDGVPPAFLLVPFLGLFVFIGSFAAGLGLRTKSIGPLLFFGIFAVLPFLMSLAQYFYLSLAMLVPIGAGALLWGYRKGANPYWIGQLRGSTTASSASPAWTMGASSNDAGKGSESSGGSQFGGGSSGGGGASGRW